MCLCENRSCRFPLCQITRREACMGKGKLIAIWRIPIYSICPDLYVISKLQFLGVHNSALASNLFLSEWHGNSTLQKKDNSFWQMSNRSIFHQDEGYMSISKATPPSNQEACLSFHCRQMTTTDQSSAGCLFTTSFLSWRRGALGWECRPNM